MKSFVTVWFSLLIGFLAVPAIAQDDQAEPPSPPSLKMVDADSDGAVTLDELKDYLLDNHIDDWSEKVPAEEGKPDDRKEMFVENYLDAWAQKVDANDNGKISKWELRLTFKCLEQVIVEQGKAAAMKSKAAANKPPSSSLEAMNLRFQSLKPAVGSRIKDLVAMDQRGEEVDFAELRDKHVVIVFGCLT